MLGTVGTQDVALVGDETLSDQGASAHGTDETVVVPVAILERDEAGSSDTSDGLGAGGTPLGEQLAIAVGAVWLLLPGGESLAGEAAVTVCATEALPMPGLVTVGHTTRLDDLVAFDASGGELLLVASCAVNIVVPWDEGSGSDGVLADHTTEALLMPLVALVLHLLSTGPEDFSASIAPGGECSVIASGTVDLLGLGAERLVYERYTALRAQEALFMPMLFLV